MGHRGLLQKIGGGAVPITLDQMVGYWKLNGNSNDVKGVLNGTDTAITYVAAKVNNGADFTAGSSSKIAVADNAILSFGNSTTDVPISASLWVKFSTIKDSWLLSKRASGATSQREYQLIYNAGELLVQFFDQSTSGTIRKAYAWTPLIGIWYNVQFTYNGNSLSSGINLFLDNVSVGTGSLTGTYVAMENNIAELTFGRALFSAVLNFNGYLDEIVFYNIELDSTQRTYNYNQGLAGLPLL